MKQTCIKLLSAMLFAFSFLSCGGGGIPSIVEGGIGGTGIGMVTGFGSVIINDDRTFQVNGDTVIRVDDSPMSETEFRNVGVGMVVRVDVSDDVNSNFTAGTAVNIIADNQVKGPVTSTSPLEVLGQTVLVTGDTVLVNVPGNDVANLVADDLVEISGFVSTTGVIQATRLEFKNTPLLEWKIEGYVSAVAGSNFSIGNQAINPNGLVLRDCPGTLSIGQLIEVKASPDPNLTTLDTLTDAECKTPGLPVPAGTSGSVLRAEVEGLVNEIITDGSDYRINGQHVVISGSTVFENGALEDLLLGARVEAEGSFNTSTGILNANKIEFREVRVRIESPVDSVSNNTLTMLGVINLRITDLTEFNGNLTSLADITANADKYEVRGFVDGDNTVYVTRIRDRNVDNLVRLRGPVASGCAPGIADFDIDILGVTIYVNDLPAAQFRDQTGAVITQDQFCTAATVGQPVNAEDGVYNPSPSRINSANRIELED